MESFEETQSKKNHPKRITIDELRKKGERIGEPMFFGPGEFYKWIMAENAKKNKEKEDNNNTSPEAA